MHTIGTIWILSVTFFRMVLLGNSLLQDDQHSDTNRKSKANCHCAPHPHPRRDKFTDPSYNYTYCRQIQKTFSCLTVIQRNKNCSLKFEIEMTTLHTGSLWQWKEYNCLSVLKRRYSTISPLTTRPNGEGGGNNGGDNNGNNGPKGRCIYKSRSMEPLHCGLFGDPHLKTFSDKRQTCVVKGAWSMLNNKYLAVQVTNVLIERNNPVATATSKITVLIKKSRNGCARQKVYQAQVGYVPTTFRDGTRETGPRSCKTNIKGEPGGNGVRLFICYLNTTILIRKVGKYLTFNIRTPENYVRQSRGLCVTGCPPREMIDYNGFFREHPNSVVFGSASREITPAMSKNEAMDLCEKANVTDFYYDSCVFDLISTGDNRFSNAAYRAMQDAVHMDPKLRLRRSNSVVLQSIRQVDKDEPVNTRPSSSSDSRGPSRTLLFSMPLLLWYLAFT